MTLTDAQVRVLRALREGAQVTSGEQAGWATVRTGRIAEGNVTEWRIDRWELSGLERQMLIRCDVDRRTQVRMYSGTTLMAAALAQHEAQA